MRSMIAMGVIVKKGYGSAADVESLDKGKYYVSYDNKTSTVYVR